MEINWKQWRINHHHRVQIFEKDLHEIDTLRKVMNKFKNNLIQKAL